MMIMMMVLNNKKENSVIFVVSNSCSIYGGCHQIKPNVKYEKKGKNILKNINVNKTGAIVSELVLKL